MSTSPLSMITEAVKKVDAELTKAFCTICDDLSGRIKEIKDAHRKEIERLHEEALAKANEEANAEAIPFDVMMEKLKCLSEEIEPEDLHDASMFWGEDAQIFSEKMAARQNEVARAMANESARQAMKRRKMMHAEGHFPDSILLGGKEA